jgi:heat shock protein HslJ
MFCDEQLQNQSCVRVRFVVCDLSWHQPIENHQIDPPNREESESWSPSMPLTKPKLGNGLAFLVIAIALSPISTVVAQTNPSPASGSGLTLTGTHWTLIELDGKSVLHSGFESQFALKADWRVVGGSTGQLVDVSADGCNRLTGSYKTNDDSLRIDPSLTTLSLCGNPPSSPPKRPGPCVFFTKIANPICLFPRSRKPLATESTAPGSNPWTRVAWFLLGWRQLTPTTHMQRNNVAFPEVPVGLRPDRK